MALATVSSAIREPTATLDPGYKAYVAAKPYLPNEIDRRVVAHLRRLIADGRFSSPYALAVTAKLDSSTIYKMFSGERGVGTDTLVKLRDNLKVQADWLLDPVPQEEMDAAIRPTGPVERIVKAAVRAHASKGRARPAKTGG